MILLVERKELKIKKAQLMNWHLLLMAEGVLLLMGYYYTQAGGLF